ncbi:MAG: ABC transporter substrate-binding protein [Verrucomicrobia bacterium]|nr:ABC transporter substrate-binding protein [Verrucomicrobiota bacterium]
MLIVLAFHATGCGSSATPGGRPGEMVYYGEGGDIKGFDPVRASDVDSALALCKIYEGLVEYDYLARPYRVVPCLAESLPEISADGLTYTFRIKKGILFQDDPCFPGGKGREVTTGDFIYTFKRLMDTKNYATGSWIFAGHVVGVDEWAKASEDRSKPTDYSRPIPGFEAPDRYTLRIRLREPYPQLLWALTMQYTFATAHEAVEFYKDDFLNHPVGTGPYRLKRWQRNYRMEFERNPTFHGQLYPSEGAPGDREKGLLADAGKPLPFIDRIILYNVREYYTWWQMFLQGQIFTVGISKDYFNKVVNADLELTPDMVKRGIVLRKEPQMDVYYLGFNMEDPVGGGGKTPEEAERHRKLRRAITCSFNQEQIRETYAGRLIPASGPITPGTTGYDPKKIYPWRFNLDLARKLIAEAGYPDGKDARTGKRLRLSLDMGGAGDAETRQLGEMYVGFVRQIGIEMTLNFSLQPEHWRKLERKETQMFSAGWVMDYPDAQNVLQLWYGPNESPGVNHCNYKNPEFDKLYQRILTMQDSPERTAIYQKMADMIVEDCPGAFMFHRLIYALLRDWVVNFKPHDFPYANMKFYKVRPH